MIKVELLEYSKNTFGQTIASTIMTYPRFIHGEIMTHRVFSRNAASSRAIPAKKMIRSILKDAFVPKRVFKTHKGMQGTQFIGGKRLRAITLIWLLASKFAALFSWTLMKLGATKQLSNRLLEPFQWYTVMVTSTEWENFTALRAHADAEIHIQEVAEQVLERLVKSQPNQLKPGEWHIPFSKKVKKEDVTKAGFSSYLKTLLKIATARCARLSYMTFDGKIDIKKDVTLHDDLVGQNPKHASPTEHPAKAMNKTEFFSHSRTYLTKHIGERIENDVENGISKVVKRKNGVFKVTEYGWCGNFRGFIQYRKMLEDESQVDLRLRRAA